MPLEGKIGIVLLLLVVLGLLFDILFLQKWLLPKLRRAHQPHVYIHQTSDRAVVVAAKDYLRAVRKRRWGLLKDRWILRRKNEVAGPLVVTPSFVFVRPGDRSGLNATGTLKQWVDIRESSETRISYSANLFLPFWSQKLYSFDEQKQMFPGYTLEEFWDHIRGVATTPRTLREKLWKKIVNRAADLNTTTKQIDRWGPYLSFPALTTRIIASLIGYTMYMESPYPATLPSTIFENGTAVVRLYNETSAESVPLMDGTIKFHKLSRGIVVQSQQVGDSVFAITWMEPNKANNYRGAVSGTSCQPGDKIIVRTGKFLVGHSFRSDLAVVVSEEQARQLLAQGWNMN